jgi:hypothetical protein
VTPTRACFHREILVELSEGHQTVSFLSWYCTLAGSWQPFISGTREVQGRG